MIAGLEERDRAARSRSATATSPTCAPRSRDIAMVFQTYALYPHMTVRQNIGYGLKARRTPKPEIARRVDEVAELLGLATCSTAGPRSSPADSASASRWAARSSASRRRSCSTSRSRTSTRSCASACARRSRSCTSSLGVTTVYVTHDQTEAMTLGQRVAVMRDGRSCSVDSPQQLYAEPNNLFIAAFIGSPAMNLVEATYRRRRGALRPVPRAARRRAAGRQASASSSGSGPRASRTRRSRPGLPTIAVDVEVRRGARLRRPRLLPRRRAADHGRGAGIGCG